MSQKSILMIAPHDAVIDPRILWEAASAAKKFQVILLGLQNQKNDAPTVENRDGYEIRRKQIKLKRTLRFSFLYYLTSLLPWPIKIVVFPLGLVLFPIILLLELLFFTITYFAKQLLTNHNIHTGIQGTPSKKTFKTKLFRKLHQIKVDFSDLAWYLDYISAISKVFLNEIHSLHHKPDIIHCNDFFSGLIGLVAKKRYNCKVIYDAHEYIPCSDPKAGAFQNSILRLYESFLIKRFDHVVTVNPLLAAVMAKDYQLQTIHSVPNAAPFVQKRGDKLPAPMTELAKGRVKFLYQGNFAPSRGIEEILRAWNYVDPSKAVLFLRGAIGAERDYYIRFAKQLNLKSVYFLEPVALKDAIDAAREADIGLIPYKPDLINHKYACPNKLSEYLQAGLMIISDNLLYVKHILNESGAGITYDANGFSLVNALHLAIEDSPLREGCKNNSFSYSKTHFNWEKMYPVLEKLYLTSSDK